MFLDRTEKRFLDFSISNVDAQKSLEFLWCPRPYDIKRKESPI